jgi:hypothetical protein
MIDYSFVRYDDLVDKKEVKILNGILKRLIKNRYILCQLSILYSSFDEDTGQSFGRYYTRRSFLLDYKKQTLFSRELKIL